MGMTVNDAGYPHSTAFALDTLTFITGPYSTLYETCTRLYSTIPKVSLTQHDNNYNHGSPFAFLP